MEIIDNINNLLGDNLKQTLKPGSKLKIAASCFSIYAYEALKQELEDYIERHRHHQEAFVDDRQPRAFSILSNTDKILVAKN